MKRVTIQDIAKEMGLSRNTVAKAFNHGAIAPETKKAILEKAWEMGYPKLDKALLESVCSIENKKIQGTVLVLFDRSPSAFWTRILSGISDGVKANGLRMQLHMVSQEELDTKELLEHLQEDVIGIIFLSVYPSEQIREIGKSGLVMTFLNTPVNAQEYIELGDVYSLESFYSMSKITNYCIEKKACKSFSFIGNAEGSRTIQARYLGFLGECNRQKVVLHPGQLYTRTRDGETRFSYREIEEIIKNMSEIPDAIICEDDEVAMNVALVLLQINPELAKKTIITGFDGIIPDEFFKKDIITVKVHMEEVGKRLVESVVNKVTDPDRDGAFVTLVTYPTI